MSWNEVDLERATWTLKGERTKSALLRVVPLPRLAVEMLSEVPRFAGPHAFSTTHGRRLINCFDYLKHRPACRRVQRTANPFPIGVCMISGGR
jgi:integrase